MKRSILSILSILALAIVAGLLTSTAISSAQGQGLSRFRRINNGDLNGDGTRDISDMIAGLQWLFNGGPEPIKPEGDDPRAELIASIQTRAEATLANLPTEEQIAKMPRSISNGFLKVRRVFTAAIQNAENWTPKDLSHYADSVSWVGVYLSTATQALSNFNPKILDPNCIPSCIAKYDECLAGCPLGDQVIVDDGVLPLDTHLECKMECDLNLADCIASCLP